jgi:membrane-associated phospholipid phosphatase
MKTKLASFISVIGHPLLTLSVFAIIALFNYEKFQMALLHSSLIVAGIFLPLTLKMYLNSRNGTYTNFDVSNKTQRQSWYIFAIAVLLIVTIILFVTDQPRTLRLSVLFSLILLGTSQIMNYLIKSSLHVSFNIFLSFLIVPMNLIAGLFFLAFTILIAWARLTLKRHTIREIITGAFIGIIIGTVSLFYIH